jgi:hypothetical protein
MIEMQRKFREIQIGPADFRLTIYVFQARDDYMPPPGSTFDIPGKERGCPHPSCDLMDGHTADGGICPYHCGNCHYCDYSDCQKSHPKCDGLTYEQRNMT